MSTSADDDLRSPARAARSIEFSYPGKPLGFTAHIIPDPGPGEVLVRLSMAGICGTDTHRLSGDLGAPPAPVNFGHEAVGFVEGIGQGAAEDRAGAPLAIGDPVFWSPVGPCGHCTACLRGHPCSSTRWPAPASSPNGAAFQELATVPPTAPLYRIPDSTTMDSVIAFGCAMPTAIGGFTRLGSVTGQVVVIQGSGPVGLASTLLASLGGARRVITIGDTEDRLAAAIRLGATDTIPLGSGTAEQRLAQVHQMTDGFGADVVIEAAGHPAAFPEGFDLLGPNGRFLILGLYSGAATSAINAVRINNLNLTIIGSLAFETSNYRRTVEMATEHGKRLDFAGLITHRFALEDTEQAISAVAAGQTIKSVVTPSDLS